MLSTLSAYDFGYIGLQELATRLQLTFESLDKLERHRGHLLNWYDTRSMQPLGQRYISTVDSGNFAACLIALKQGMAELRRALPLRWQFWEGWLDHAGYVGRSRGRVQRSGRAHSDKSTASNDRTSEGSRVGGKRNPCRVGAADEIHR